MKGLLRGIITMPKSYVDEIVVRYLIKEGYLISQGIWFPLKRERTGKKVSGWSDIDIFAVKPKEAPLIIQCKSFSGTEKSDIFVSKIVNWFNNAEEFFIHSDYHKWISEGAYRKIFVVDYSVKKTEEGLKMAGIEVWNYKDMLNKLLKKLKDEQEKRTEEKGKNYIGKEEDILLRIFSDMLRREIIKKEIFEEGK